MELGRAAARGRFAGPLTLGAAGRVAGELQEAWRGTTAPARRRPAGSSTVTLVPTSSWLKMTRRPPCSTISAPASARSRPALGEGGRGVEGWRKRRPAYTYGSGTQAGDAPRTSGNREG